VSGKSIIVAGVGIADEHNELPDELVRWAMRHRLGFSLVALLGACTAAKPSVEVASGEPPTLVSEPPVPAEPAAEPEPSALGPACRLAATSAEYPSPLYENLFRLGARFEFHATVIPEEHDEADEYGNSIDCKVERIETFASAIAAEVRCDAVDAAASRSPADVPREVSPEGVYVATAAGLFRRAEMPSESELASLSLAELVMLPEGGDCVVRDDGRGNTVTLRTTGSARQCSNASASEGRSMALCFRRGAGVIDGEYELPTANRLFRGYYELRTLDLPAVKGPKRAPELVLNEIVPRGEVYDWFEVVNVSDHAIQLDDFVYVDRPFDTARRDEFDFSARVIAFPTLTLPAGGYHVQLVSRDHGDFALSSTQGEWLSIHRADDLSRVDRFEWPSCDELGVVDGQCVLARKPNLRGKFVTTPTPTPGKANTPD
jgi:hypothetical protein